jgi:hypothetical protein
LIYVGNWVVNLKEAENSGALKGEKLSALGRKVLQGEYLNDFMGLSRAHWKEVRSTIQDLFSVNSQLKDNE